MVRVSIRDTFDVPRSAVTVKLYALETRAFAELFKLAFVLLREGGNIKSGHNMCFGQTFLKAQRRRLAVGLSFFGNAVLKGGLLCAREQEKSFGW